MKKFKILLTGLILATSFNIAFAGKKNIKKSQPTTKNIFEIKKVKSKLCINSQAKKEVEKIDFDSNIKKNLVDNNLLYLKKNLRNPNEKNYVFIKIEDNKIVPIPYENFKIETKRNLIKTFRRILKKGKQIDYSKIKIKLPKGCLFYFDDSCFFVTSVARIKLNQNGEFLNTQKFINIPKTKTAINLFAKLVKLNKKITLKKNQSNINNVDNTQQQEEENEDFDVEENKKYFKEIFMDYLNGDLKTEEKIEK